MSTHEQHLFLPCPSCGRSGLMPLDATARKCLAAGLKAGTCGDWLECGDCHGTGKVEMVERLSMPTAHSLIVNGFRK